MKQQWVINTVWCILLLFAAPLSLQAQSVGGAVYNSDSIKAIRGAIVTNLRTDISVPTSRSGTYRIVAREGDTIRFVHEGHRPLHVVIDMDKREMHEVVFMRKLSVSLAEFELSGDQRVRDSISQRQVYRETLKDAAHRPGVNRVNGAPSGFGVEIDGPITYGIRKLTGEGKRLKKFKTEFEATEKEKFIRSRYTTTLVSSLTQLNAEDAERFIIEHPLPYELAAYASDLELKAWIREQYKLSRQPKRTSTIRTSQ